MTPGDGLVRLGDYDFDLPRDLIAQEPPAQRSESRLLVLDRTQQGQKHDQFINLSSHLKPGDLLVLNDTRVLPARAFGIRDSTSGQVEMLFLEPLENGAWRALLKTRGTPDPGENLTLLDGRLKIEFLERIDRGIAIVRPLDGEDITKLLEQHGSIPLPPYIRRDPRDDTTNALDRDRYQTIYATHTGAVAAPTAGLHFTGELLQELRALGIHTATVTLHVGLGTFQPIEVEDISTHVMHEEWYRVPRETALAVARARAAGGRVIAVGTTSLRCLESSWEASNGTVRAMEGRTRLFIHPPHRVKSVDALLTNFHLPMSTLMLLVSALAGRDRILTAYQEAMDLRYRFFSYGDAMLIL